MNTTDEDCRVVLKDLLRFVKAMARGDQYIAREAAQHLEESLEALLNNEADE